MTVRSFGLPECLHEDNLGKRITFFKAGRSYPGTITGLRSWHLFESSSVEVTFDEDPDGSLYGCEWSID